MEITLNITEDSKVELVKDGCEAVQGERNVTILRLNFPNTIRGYSINNYAKQIEFAECKELGECVKFLDVVEGDTYKLCDICTQFEKIMIQFTLKNLVDEAEPIVWKSVPFALEFCESINAENTKESQVALLSLAEIESEWEEYIRANTFRVVSRVEDVSTADATNLGKVMFYLGANSTSPYVLTYGHYYRCNYVNNVYEWTDLTQDPSLEGVANGIREINNNQTMQLWIGQKEKLENEVTQTNVMYIPEDQNILETFDEILDEMAQDGSFPTISRKKKLWGGNVTILPNSSSNVSVVVLSESILNKKLYIETSNEYGRVVGGYIFDTRNLDTATIIVENYTPILCSDIENELGIINFRLTTTNLKQLIVSGHYYSVNNTTATRSLKEYITAVYEMIE